VKAVAVPKRRLRLEPLPLYTMWLRQMIRFFRMRSRVIAMVLTPPLLLAILAIPMSRLMPYPNAPLGQFMGLNFFGYLVPGVVGIILLFGGMMGGVTVLMDKEFGFLKEVMVAPVSRLSIIAGRSLGFITTTLIQALVMVGIAALFGIHFGFHVQSAGGFWLAVVFMVLTCAVFIGFALTLASLLEETEGFMAILNLIQMPIMFLSGAMIPIGQLTGLPFLYQLQFINPFTYGVDGLRGSLTAASPYVLDPYTQTMVPFMGSSHYFPLAMDFGVLLAWAVVLWVVGAYFFSKMQVD
jgi:ABC-2 type transport system permease protein